MDKENLHKQMHMWKRTHRMKREECEEECHATIYEQLMTCSVWWEWASHISGGGK